MCAEEASDLQLVTPEKKMEQLRLICQSYLPAGKSKHAKSPKFHLQLSQRKTSSVAPHEEDARRKPAFGIWRGVDETRLKQLKVTAEEKQLSLVTLTDCLDQQTRDTTLESREEKLPCRQELGPSSSVNQHGNFALLPVDHHLRVLSLRGS